MPGCTSGPHFLNQKRYSALQYRGPGTDFRLGLADDHLWLGGGTTAGNGAYCIPNMPTEEVFTHSAQGPRRWHGDGDQAALAPGHDDRGHPGAL